MATYAELLSASENETLQKKLRVAVVIAAEVVRTEADTVPKHAERLAWAKQVFIDPSPQAERMMWAVLAQNRAFTLAQIVGADDATVQSAVNNAIDVFAQV